MSTTAVGHCDKCAAVVNRHWRKCLVCHAELSAGPTHPVVTEEATKQQALDPIHTIQPGDRITWQRGDLSMPAGTVDFVHVDDTGTRWAFVTLGESWTAVNCKFVKAVTA